MHIIHNTYKALLWVLSQNTLLALGVIYFIYLLSSSNIKWHFHLIMAA